MKRKSKKGSGVLDYLETSGILEWGSYEDIEHAKKMYWTNVRKDYKKQKRKECKSITIFLSPEELHTITKAMHKGCKLTAWVKDSVIAFSTKEQCVDKIAVGEIRQAFMMHYLAIQAFEETNSLPEKIAETLLHQIARLEEKTLQLLKPH